MHATKLIASAGHVASGPTIFGITRDNIFVRMKDEEWDQVIAVNLTAAFRLSRAALRPKLSET